MSSFKRPWVAFWLVLSLLAVGMALLTHKVFTERIDDAQRGATAEAGYVAGLAKDLLQIGSYQGIGDAMRAWSAANASTAALTLTAKTGAVLGSYQRAQPAIRPVVFESTITYSYSGVAHLTLVKDFGPVYEERRQLALQLSVIYVIVGLTLAIFVRLSQRRHLEAQLLIARTEELSRANAFLREQMEQRQFAELALQKEKELAEVTLHSIGDAVITTDIEGRIELFNAVAESLTGWTAADAWGRKIGTVLRLVHEQSGEPLADPVERALKDESSASQEDRAVLVARDGTRHAIHDSASPIRSHDGQLLGCIIVFQDVTEKRELLDRIVWQASHDTLTELPNRALLSDRLAQGLAHAERHGQLLIVCFVDLDGFKPINDNYGHEAGDALLKQVAHRLTDAVRSGDTVARLGGDEFVILLTELNSLDALEPAVLRILETMAKSFVCNDNLLHLTASMGVTVYPRDHADADGLLRHADHAMYLAKQAGRNGYRMFDTKQEYEIRVRHRLVDEFSAALRSGDLKLYYQPKVAFSTGQVVGFEGLLRWPHPTRGLLLPHEFLPAIEHTELVVELGEWVLATALAALGSPQLHKRELPVSINISARDLQQPDFMDRLRQQFKKSPSVAHRMLELEILESGAMQDMASARAVVVACQEMGVAVSLDDFGTGYSSLTYLKELPAQVIKIDRSFVCNMLDDENDLALVAGIVSLAGAFGRSVVAEGVESTEHGVLLMRMGCDRAQGFSIARPMELQAVEAWLAAFQPDPLWAKWHDLAWSLDDLPILAARRNAGRCVSDIAQAVGARVLPELSRPNAAVVAFEQWSLSTGKARYGELPELAAARLACDQCNQGASRALRLCTEGRWSEAAEFLPELEGACARAYACLDRLLEKVTADAD